MVEYCCNQLKGATESGLIVKYHNDYYITQGDIKLARIEYCPFCGQELSMLPHLLKCEKHGRLYQDDQFCSACVSEGILNNRI